jgi:hypothetical protein
MRSLQAVTDCEGWGAGGGNASFRVTFIVQQLFGAELHPISEIG